MVTLKKCLQINKVREKPGRHAGTNDPVFRVMLQIAINRLAKKFIGIVSSEKLGGGGSVSLTFFLIAIHSQDHLHCQRQASETLCSFGQKQSFLVRGLERYFPINPCVFHDSLHYMEDKCSKEERSGFNNIIHYL